MATLVRWNPFAEMIDLRQRMDQLLGESWRSMEDWQPEGGAVPLALDIKEDENKYTVQASIPGIKPDDLDITVHDHMLTISGEMKHEEEKKGEQYHLRERRYGKFMRSVNLPAAVNSEKAEASFENGVLTLQLPKSEEARPKRISVGGNRGKQS
ncbi:MAG: heat-shock protein Hsp20 [Chloroflexi bacterium]|nr:MAG: heat-shock protein Hsp20 [Chloroflexota bacterium]